MIKLFNLILAVTAFLEVQSQSQCVDGPCWEKCFLQPSASLANEYADILQVVNRLRSGRNLAPNPVTSTTFFIDGTAPSVNMFQYQKLLAGISAYAIPVSSTCNKFFSVTYYNGLFFFFWPTAGFFSFPSGSPQCLNRCQAAQITQFLPFSPQSSINPLGLACFFANIIPFFTPTCPAGSNKYGIAIVNGAPQNIAPFDSACDSFNVRGSVDISASLPPTFFATSPAFAPKSAFSTSKLTAAQQIFNCVQAECTCPPLNRRGDVSSVTGDTAGTLFYSTAEDVKNVKKVENVKLGAIKEVLDKLQEENGGGNGCVDLGKCTREDCRSKDAKTKCPLTCGYCKPLA